MRQTRNKKFSGEAAMSRIVEARELRDRDMFEMPNGSVYVAAGPGEHEGARQARLWCAHPPDAVTFDPPRIDLPPGQQVHLLSGNETRVHYRHDGYVDGAFGREMDRRHGANMHVVYEQRQREAAAQRQRAQAGRPWWKKLLS